MNGIVMRAQLTRHLQALASLRTLRIELLQGELRTDGSPLTALYAGNGSNAEYLLQTLFAGNVSRRTVAHCMPFALASKLRRFADSAEIVLCERAPLWALLGKRIGDFRMPAWLRQELLLPEPGERWQLGRHLEREVDRQIRRHDYRLVLSQDAADKDMFYSDFYCPYIRSRHGSGAVTADRSTFLAVAARTTLAKLMAGEQWTAGMLLRQSGQTLQLGWFGSRLIPPASGASEVLDVLAIRAAAQSGVRHISFGNSRPSLCDGVVRYKRKFGAQFVMPRFPQTVIELRIRSDRRALQDWLNEQQFVCHRRNKLVIAGYSREPAVLRFSPVETSI